MTNFRRRDPRLIDVALGQAPADKVVADGTLVNVVTKEVYRADLAILGDRIAAVGDVDRCVGPSTQTISAAGKYLVPGLVEPHLHAYHSYTSVTNVAKALLLHGTTTTADGIYGPSIIGGISVVKSMIEEYGRTPLKLVFVVPVVGYLQNRELGLEAAPNSINADEMMEMLDWPDTIGLEEPPYLPVVQKDPVFIELYRRAIERGLVITGHAAGIDVPAQLHAYVAAGTVTDHEAVEAHVALEEARAGMRVLMRQGSGAFDLRELSRAITEYGADPRFFTYCADLASPEKLVHEGDIDECIREAVKAGIDPVTAIQLGTLTAAEVYKLDDNIGSITPGRFADIVLVDDLRDFVVGSVIANGDVVVRDGAFVNEVPPPEYPPEWFDTVRIQRPLVASDFDLPAPDGPDRVTARIIGVVDLSLHTKEVIEDLAVEDGVVQPDPSRDILAISMIDRHAATGVIGNAFVKGFGLKRGAFASSVNAVCEDILVVGSSKEDMAVAANHIAAIGGGKVAVVDGEVMAEVKLPLLGLFSADPLEKLIEDFSALAREIRELGSAVTHPFSTLEFCGACGEIGKIKLSPVGLIDVHKIERVDVILEGDLTHAG
jgi:adenine deaminase